MHYQLLEAERALPGEEQQGEELQCLRANAHTKMQEVRSGSRNYFASFRDEHEFPRMLIFALLAKIHHHYSARNANALGAFKQMVLSSSLRSLVSLYSVPANQLLLLFSQKLREVPIGTDSDEAVCRLMNCEQLVEEVMTTALTQAVAPLEMREAPGGSRDEACVRWAGQLGFAIKITDECVLEEGEDEMFLAMSCERVVRQAYRQEAESQSASTSFPRIDCEPDPRKSRAGLQESVVWTERSPQPSGCPRRKSASQPLQLAKEEQMVNSEWKNCGTWEKKLEERSFFDIFFCCNAD